MPHFSWFSSFRGGRKRDRVQGNPGKAGIEGVGRLEEEISELLRTGASINAMMASPPNTTQTPATNEEPGSISLTGRSTTAKPGCHTLSPITLSIGSIGFLQASFICLSHWLLALSQTSSQTGSIFLSHSAFWPSQYSLTFWHWPITFSQDCAMLSLTRGLRPNRSLNHLVHLVPLSLSLTSCVHL